LQQLKWIDRLIWEKPYRNLSISYIDNWELNTKLVH
jgi:hypothetical protein